MFHHFARRAFLQHGKKLSKTPLSTRRSCAFIPKNNTRLLSTTTNEQTQQQYRPEPTSSESFLQIGTRRIFTSEHDQFREVARRFFTDRVIPFHDEWEEKGEVSREVWKEAGSHGLLGVTMPEKYGGAGADIFSAAIVWEEQSYSNCTGPGFALHSEIVMPYILHYGTEEQKAKYLPKLISGEWVGAIAMTEPGAGSDLQGVRTTAVQQPSGDFLINGSKTFITNGALADVVIVVTKTDPSKKAHGITLFIIERGFEGFQRGKKLKKIGLKAQDTSELFFDNVKVPASQVLGQVNQGFYYLMQELPQERLLIADLAVSAAEWSFETSRKYLKERKVFNRPAIDLQTIRHKLAEMKTEVAIGRTFADHCLELHSQKRLDSATASMAKYWLTDLQVRIADQAVQLHGGWGYMWEYGVGKQFVDARVQPIYGGTNEIMKELISRTL